MRHRCPYLPAASLEDALHRLEKFLGMLWTRSDVSRENSRRSESGVSWVEAPPQEASTRPSEPVHLLDRPSFASAYLRLAELTACRTQSSSFSLDRDMRQEPQDQLTVLHEVRECGCLSVRIRQELRDESQYLDKKEEFSSVNLSQSSGAPLAMLSLDARHRRRRR